MADEKIRIDLEAQDNASAKIDAVADAAEAVEKVDPTVDVEADTRRALADLDAADAAAKELAARDVEIALEAKVGDLRQQLKTAEGDLDRFRASAGSAAGGMDRLTESGDQSRSVMANLVGNSAQDLGAVGGAAGSAGVALGQFAEYAADGNISLAKAATMGPAIAGVALAVGEVTKRLNAAAETRAFNKEQVEGWVDAMLKGASAAEAVTDSFREAGKVEFRLGDTTQDATQAIAEMGLSIEDFTRLTKMSDDELESWAHAQQDAGADADALGVVVAAASQGHDNLADAEKRAAINAEVFGDAAEDTAEEVESLDDKYARLTARLDDDKAALNAADSIAGIRDAYVEALGASFEYGEGSREAEAANRDLQSQMIAAEEDVIAYAESVGGIPDEKMTELQAAIRAGDVAKAEGILDNLTRDRTVTVKARADANFQRIVDLVNRLGGYAVGGTSAPGGTAVNVTMNLPVGLSARGVVDEVDNYARRNGNGRAR